MFSRLKFSVDFISEDKKYTILNLKISPIIDLYRANMSGIGLEMAKIDCQKNYFEKSLDAIVPQI